MFEGEEEEVWSKLRHNLIAGLDNYPRNYKKFIIQVNCRGHINPVQAFKQQQKIIKIIIVVICNKQKYEDMKISSV